MHLTARRKGPKKVVRKRKPQSPSNKFYATVWLSDYESEPDKSYSLSSHATTPYNSQPTSPWSSRPSSPSSSRPNTPLNFYDSDSGFPSDIERSFDSLNRPRKKLYRTMSLPDSELASIQAADLHERFASLQLEQENRDLKKLTVDLQDALEKLEERVNQLQSIENDSLDEETLPRPVSHLDIPLDSPASLQVEQLPSSFHHRNSHYVESMETYKCKTQPKKKKSHTTCCMS